MSHTYAVGVIMLERLLFDVDDYVLLMNAEDTSDIPASTMHAVSLTSRSTDAN